MGKTSKCKVDETEKGWYIAYIDRDPKKIARQIELKKKAKEKADDAERNQMRIKRQIASSSTAVAESVEPQDFARAPDAKKLKVSFSKKPDTSNASAVATNIFNTSQEVVALSKEKKKAGGAIDLIMREERAHSKSKSFRKENWITKGIVVKVMEKVIGNGKYYKQKGEVLKVIDKFGAEVRMLESRDVIQLDQDDLETVIPQVDSAVKIVNGRGRGQSAIVLALNLKNYSATIKVADTRSKDGSLPIDSVVEKEYEDICKKV